LPAGETLARQRSPLALGWIGPAVCRVSLESDSRVPTHADADQRTQRGVPSPLCAQPGHAQISGRCGLNC
jgi:hypothetical protein